MYIMQKNYACYVKTFNFLQHMHFYREQEMDMQSL